MLAILIFKGSCNQEGSFMYYNDFFAILVIVENSFFETMSFP